MDRDMSVRVLAGVRVALCSGFGGCSVLVCSGFTSAGWQYIIQKVNNCKFFGFSTCSGCSSFARTRSRFKSRKAGSWLYSACSGCSGKTVENLCKRLWKNLWGKSGKDCGKVEKGRILVAKVGISRVLHGIVEKFYHGFSTRIFPCKRLVLHSFHRAYYNYNYFLYRGKEI